MKEWGQQLLQRVWVDRLDKRLPGLVTVVVLAMLLQSLASLTWRFVPVPANVDRVMTSSGGVVHGQVSANTGNKLVASTIASWNLFGAVQVKKPEATPVINIEAAPDTRLNLKLRGVFAASNPRHSRAIIADARNEEASYAVGDTVPGGAVLKQVFRDKVILEHNGQLETLRLPVEDSQSSSGGSNDTGGRMSASRSAPRQVAGMIQSPIVQGNADTGALLHQYRDALLNDPQSVMGLVRATPFEKDGQLYGYRIRPGNDRQILKRFGLRSGDVVTAVNGVPMNNPIKALEVLRDLSTATQLTVDVDRHGQLQSFSFPINP